ncbi:MAG TPA: TonB-dependent receptor, partial [Kofleriaceae bacterium]|nr:TonB-dependent receptor [Kofleriaceae bacterium]
MRPTALLAAGLAAAGARIAAADPVPAPEPPPGEVIVVVADPLPRETASEEIVTREELAVQPRRTPGQLLAATPALVVGQHAGGGKADQILLRGFDADHGTDVAVFVDGVPVNMPSHGHGQGYADLHFVIPEMIDHIHIKKGPTDLAAGDFSAAGSIRLETRDRIDESAVSASAGSFDTYRLFGVSGGSLGRLHGWAATELYTTDGPFDDPQDLRRHNVMARAGAELSPTTQLSLLATSYGAGWNASGQIPLREVEAGRLSRFGAIDPSEGGTSSRHGAVLNLLSHPGDGDDDIEVAAYAHRTQLDLFSNFTFAADDPMNGDGIEQVDARSVFGARAESRLRRDFERIHVASRLGVDARHDRAALGLFDQRERQRLGVRHQALIEQTSVGSFGEVAAGADRRWHLAMGGRFDVFSWNVGETEGDVMAGSASRAIASPRLRGDWRALSADTLHVDLHGAAGAGFHSNDARSVVASPADTRTALPRAWGAELGARAREKGGAWEMTLVGWGLRLDSELTWVGDAGGTQARGESRRLGLEATGKLRLLSWLFGEGEVALTRARFADGGFIPLAPGRVIGGGLTAHHPIGAAGQIRVRHLGGRPATEDGSLAAAGHTVVDAIGSYRHG